MGNVAFIARARQEKIALKEIGKNPMAKAGYICLQRLEMAMLASSYVDCQWKLPDGDIQFLREGIDDRDANPMQAP